MTIPKSLRRPELLAAFGVVALIIIVGIVNRGFIAPANLIRVANSAVILALLAAGSTLVILTRNIDVSVGSTLALTGVVGGTMLSGGSSPIVAILTMIALGGALGAVNGLGVTYGHVPSIVMTLGTLGAYRGISFLITSGYSIENIPSSYRQIGSTSFLGVPILVWVGLAVLIALGLFVAKTRLGRHVYATGDNEIGAKLVGIRTEAVVIFAYVMSGMFAGCAASVFLAQVGSISNQAGQGIEMRAIAAAVIGGVALSGGVGTVFGAVFGALFVTTAVSSLSFLGVPGFWGDTVIGAILLLALFGDARMRSMLENRRIRERYRAVEGEAQS